MKRGDKSPADHRAKAAQQVGHAIQNLRKASNLSMELRSAALAQVLEAACDVYAASDTATYAAERLLKAAQVLIDEPRGLGRPSQRGPMTEGMRFKRAAQAIRNGEDRA